MSAVTAPSTPAVIAFWRAAAASGCRRRYSNRPMPLTWSKAVSPVRMVCIRLPQGPPVGLLHQHQGPGAFRARYVSAQAGAERCQREATRLDFAEQPGAGKEPQQSVERRSARARRLSQFITRLRTVGQEIGHAKLGNQVDGLGHSVTEDELVQLLQMLRRGGSPCFATGRPLHWRAIIGQPAVAARAASR